MQEEYLKHSAGVKEWKVGPMAIERSDNAPIRLQSGCRVARGDRDVHAAFILDITYCIVLYGG